MALCENSKRIKDANSPAADVGCITIKSATTKNRRQELLYQRWSKADGQALHEHCASQLDGPVVLSSPLPRHSMCRHQTLM
jgi:hypothetical protein